jgi:CHAT domain-containing protein
MSSWIRFWLPEKPGHILILLLLFLFSENSICQVDQASLSEALKNSAFRADDLADSLIRNNRLLIKPFIDRQISESIKFECQGKTEEAEKSKFIAEKIAAKFKLLFAEESLLIGVNYLDEWSPEQKKKKLESDSIYDSGTRLRLKNENDQAVNLFHKALEIYTAIGDERGQAEVLGGLGVIYFGKQDSVLAIKYYNDALLKREKVNDRALTGNTLNSFGSVYYSFHKDYKKAIDYYRKAESIRIEIGDNAALRTTRLYLIYAYKGLGNRLRDEGKYPESLRQFENAFEIANQIGQASEKGEILNQLGLIHFHLGDNSIAIEKLSEASEIMKELQDSSGLAGVFNHFGIVLQNAGRYEKALQYYNEALDFYQVKNRKADQLPVLSNLGTLFTDQKQYSKASDYLTRGLAISRELNDDAVVTDFLINLANTRILSGKQTEAINNYTEALKLAREHNNPDKILRILLGMAEFYETAEDYSRVIELNDSALKMIDELRRTIQNPDSKASYIARERYIFEDVIDLLSSLYAKDAAKDYEKLAFIYSEASKSRVLLDLLSGTLQGSEPCTIDEARGMLGKNDILLEYSVGDSSSSLWVITGSVHMLYKIPGRRELQEKNELLRFALMNPDQTDKSFLVRTAGALYDILIKPAEHLITGQSRLIIIPDDVLNYLPFEVLLTGDCNENEDYFKLPFLVKKYPVSYAQSAGVLKSLVERKDNQQTNTHHKTLLAFGDPVLEDRQTYERLEFSGTEITEIASYFNKKTFRAFYGQDASENKVKDEINGEASYLHFATHGYVDEQKPDLSGLILSTDNTSSEDGFLQSYEIYRLKLNTDLVVLSACQTGIGKLIRGEGMIGLTRAFMYAGAPSVLVSLWNVSDYSTSKLMGEFYKNLIKNKLDKSSALRKAQISLMSDEKYAHPFYWAPFVLLGDWR